MRKAVNAGCAAVLALVIAPLAGCMTATPQEVAALCSPLDLALFAPADQLRASADRGDAQSQFALSIIYTYGLRDQPLDRPRAAMWLRRALAPRGYSLRTLFVAGYKDHPGYVMPLTVPVEGIPSAQIAAVESCIALLNGPKTPEALGQAAVHNTCGGADDVRRLSAGWANATAPSHPAAPLAR